MLLTPAFRPIPELPPGQIRLVTGRTAAGKAFFDMLGVFAEFETNLRRERQAEGIAKAKRNGVYTGGKRRIDREEVATLISQGLSLSEVARQLGVPRRQIYRIRDELVEAG